MKASNTAARLREIMTVRNLKQVDILRLCEPVSRRLGIRINRNDLSQYVNGKVEPGQFKLTVLAHALSVSETWLMGYDVPMTAVDLPPEVSELAQMIARLDTEDRAEIRGEVRAMLRADKYQKSAKQDA